MYKIHTQVIKSACFKGRSSGMIVQKDPMKVRVLESIETSIAELFWGSSTVRSTIQQETVVATLWVNKACVIQQ